MGERILAENKHVETVSYSLPNKHYIPVDMRYAGIDNLTPYVSLCVVDFLFRLPLHFCLFDFRFSFFIPGYTRRKRVTLFFFFRRASPRHATQCSPIFRLHALSPLLPIVHS